MNKQARNLVEQATFTIHTKKRGDGQCVLIEGGFILTAAHCTDYNCGEPMALGDSFLSTISTAFSDITADTLAIEPRADIAVLGSPDAHSLPREAIAFEQFVERITPVKLQRHIPEIFAPFPVWIRTHRKKWVAGEATYPGGSSFGYKTKIKICCGTSGGPIVNDAGQLVGVVSNGGEKGIGVYYDSMAPFAALAMPAWVLQQIGA